MSLNFAIKHKLTYQTWTERTYGIRSRLATAYPEGGGDTGHYSFPGKPTCCSRDNGEPVSGMTSQLAVLGANEVYQTKVSGKILKKDNLFRQYKKGDRYFCTYDEL